MDTALEAGRESPRHDTRALRKMSMRLFPARPNLDEMIRRWQSLPRCREADGLWTAIDAEIRARVRRQNARHGDAARNALDPRRVRR